MTEPNEGDLRAARGGDRAAFERMIAPYHDRLRALTYRSLGHREDAADAAQETLLRAFAQLATFRAEASFATWLFRIATNVCLDALRHRGRWRTDAQPMTRDECLTPASALHRDLAATVHDPSFVFEAREHIAFCFTCVARSLEPEAEMALVLSDVFDMDNRQAAALLGVTESVFRHRLSAARNEMQHVFDGLCALVTKAGVCYQCKELRDYAREGHRGGEIPPLGEREDPPESRWRRRLTVVKDAPPEGGRSRALHDLLSTWIGRHAVAAKP